MVLAILDGWGLSPSWGGNAIEMAMPVHFNELWRQYPHAVLQALRAVHQPQKEESSSWIRVGNSEIGHAIIGAGRLLRFDLDELNEAVVSGAFFQNPALRESFSQIKDNGALHLIGLVSDGGVHSHINHLEALLRLAKQFNLTKVLIHFIADGIDTPQTSALTFIQKTKEIITTIGIGRIASITGRFYAMDRDSNWKNTSACGRLLLQGKGLVVGQPEKAIADFYRAKLTDDKFPPTLITDCKNDFIRPNDTVVFFNFRPDRMRQLVTLIKKDEKNLQPKVITLTSYFYQADDNDNVKVAFPPSYVKNTLAAVISAAGWRQCHLAESEKYAHVTYFFNVGKEKPLDGEERLIINSLPVNKNGKISQPEMRTPEIVDQAIKKIKSKKFEFILINFGNLDMVAHSGDPLLTGRAVKAIDKALDELSRAVLDAGGSLVITADHGNAEQIVNIADDLAGDPETFHTLNPVPLIVVARPIKKNLISQAMTVDRGGLLAEIVNSRRTLADVAPTVLTLMNLPIPQEMTGKSLI
ncbi:MAG: 2,3-bisphosphoglycerate-independent phosphoglycerate mutase [Candidatus Berkelbacteria bacterium Licking1014_2]|uniref:2,3-bisphosphoglycerate-independent phosphoglycerate mutase n=1 Tax=Candidatus Berkelbacteria bacterium Licking1014_2 TaxID=2017146 RepID=A0A554LW90_9BACT|nr:MAG: 2,3-bisphosphoglycerate-independent phosphoglycerate mutase [Candidatus Berkelbacteria bacterium Licking1014_2]